MIGAVVAKNQSIAQKAARMVKVDYEELEPLILTIEVRIIYISLPKLRHYYRYDVHF